MRNLSKIYTIEGGKLKKHYIIHPESDSDCDSDSDNEGRGLYAGGSILDDIKSGLNKVGSFVTAKKGGLASELVNRGIPAVTGALGGIAGSMLTPEFAPLGGIAGSQLGALGGRYAARAINKSAGTGVKCRGRPRKSICDVEGGALFGINRKQMDKFMHPNTGGTLKNDLVKAYNKAVPKKLQPAVNNLAGELGNYALDKAGYGEPIPTGKGFKKGSPEMKERMARMRAMRKK